MVVEPAGELALAPQEAQLAEALLLLNLPGSHWEHVEADEADAEVEALSASSWLGAPPQPHVDDPHVGGAEIPVPDGDDFELAD